jgi:hypothetical protein
MAQVVFNQDGEELSYVSAWLNPMTRRALNLLKVELDLNTSNTIRAALLFLLANRARESSETDTQPPG